MACAHGAVPSSATQQRDIALTAKPPGLRALPRGADRHAALQET
ncbi:MarR family transcriptional regulator [Xanthomonas cissicola]|nr:MarR family transcriptional regulator [Xanthomonas cissicola]OOW54381.1 MarR family transcriptional regulator [Xanthomonas campestris pv. centellae]